MSAVEPGNVPAALPGIPAVEQVDDLAVGSGKYLALVLTNGAAVVPL